MPLKSKANFVGFNNGNGIGDRIMTGALEIERTLVFFWVPMLVVKCTPQRHLNPVKPTFFLQMKHMFNNFDSDFHIWRGQRSVVSKLQPMRNPRETAPRGA
ncbi:hypothetical protein F3Y22_tig00112471pilonHSYRG00114 [Hibiscus syriacus]|uniref:Uncharacterized protein n=1 Tax=Hibiscus syriacus TaxID=106335 RepID=A0A6A2Y3X4_HIBSY|nr:hypothetical protein F3Y22_tig00112471pilonHSYRG00114 [Hibiscus syriacus]